MVKVLVHSYVDSSFIGEVEQVSRPKTKDVVVVGEASYRVNKVVTPDLFDTVNNILKIRVKATQVG